MNRHTILPTVLILGCALVAAQLSWAKGGPRKPPPLKPAFNAAAKGPNLPKAPNHNWAKGPPRKPASIKPIFSNAAKKPTPWKPPHHRFNFNPPKHPAWAPNRIQTWQTAKPKPGIKKPPQRLTDIFNRHR